MKTVLKFKWPIMLGLILLTAALFLLAPNLTQQAEEAGSFQLSEVASSQLAHSILKDAGAAGQTISLVFVLDREIDTEISEDLKQLTSDLEAINGPIASVINPVGNEELKDQLVSEDGQTVLMPITVEGTDKEINQATEKIKELADMDAAETYLTGQAILNNDVNESAQAGLKKTEIITVILIFGLLLAVFRSIITPLVPLIAVGISYLLSQSIVAFFIDWFGFPVSNYTQIFLVAILFGIGTDYAILLLSRYKEELASGGEVEEAILNTYRTAGKTLFISGLSGFIAFLAIGFADFPIFKSAVAVAIGIFVLLIILFTVVPFFMAILKEKLFWPSKKSVSHSDSKIWIWISKLSVNRPLLAMLLVAVITVPLVFFYDNALSFNNVDEIGSEYESVKGLEAIEAAFGKGNSLPVQIIVKSDDKLNGEEIVPYFDLLSRDILKVEGVETVRAIIRPTGTVIEDFYVDSQLGMMAEGLNEARGGLVEIGAGLAEIEGNLAIISQQTGDAAGIEEAVTRLAQVNQQLDQLTQGLRQTGDIPQTVGALEQVAGGLSEIQQGLATGVDGSLELGSGLSQIADGIDASNDGLVQIAGGLEEAATLLQAISDNQTVRETGIYLPAGALAEDEFKPLLDQYTFAEGTGMLMEVVLAMDPYSPEAIDVVTEIKSMVARSVVNSPLEDTEIAYGGISSINSDLADISSSDFTRTAIIMLTSLFVVLAFLLRSLIMPLYMIGSLLLTYIASISLTEFIFVTLLGYDGITWAVPFFGFVMLVALGVDYSIFLLDRFQEETLTNPDVHQAMRTSMAKMGTVIITAAIILAGTFGAMLPSGVLSLMQIASIVITGLLLYGLIVLPLLVPAMTVSFGNGAWWPFGNRSSKK